MIDKAKAEMRTGITVLRYLAGMIEELGELEKEYQFRLTDELPDVMTRVKKYFVPELKTELKPLVDEYVKLSALLGEFKDALNYKPYEKEDYTKRVYGYCNAMDKIIGKSDFVLRPRDLDPVLLQNCKGKNYHDTANNAFHYLEDIIRKKVNVDSTYYSSKLINYAFDTQNGKIITSQHNGEREGYFKLFSGAFQSLRNSTSHTLIAEQERDESLKLIYFVDMLIKIVERSPLRK